jgi:flagellar protein FlaJ
MVKKIDKLAYKWFGKFTSAHPSENLKLSLESAHMNIKSEAYMASAFFYSIIGTIISIITVIVFYYLLTSILAVELPFIIIIIFWTLPIMMFGLVFLAYTQIPASVAKSRGKKIDLNLSYALNFVAAMSSAGVTPTEIFHSLSKQTIYGEVQQESSWIYRDVTIIGKDIISAIRDNMKRTPSEKFKEFLQGLVVTVTSGGSLKPYFSSKANQFMVENRQKQRQMFESLGIMAESYVTSAVAGILLLFIVIPLMMIISGNTSQVTLLYLIVFLLVPLVHGGFAYIIKSMSMEG